MHKSITQKVFFLLLERVQRETLKMRKIGSNFPFSLCFFLRCATLVRVAKAFQCQ